MWRVFLKMKCTVCGSEINPGDKFCMACGTSVESMGLKAAATPAQAQTQSAAQPVVQPAYAQPQPAYAQSQPAYAQPQPAYAQPQPVSYNDRINSDVAASTDATPILALGIVALATSLSFYFSIAGIICGAIGLAKSNDFMRKYGALTGKANTGRHLSRAGLIVGIVMTSFFALCILLYAIGEA